MTDDTTSTPDPVRLFGMPDWEIMFRDLDSAIEHADDREVPRPYVIEERDVIPPQEWMPDAETLIEYLVEMTCDDYGAEHDPWIDAEQDPRLLELANGMRDRLAELTTFHWADDLVAEHHVPAFINDQETHE